jgi:large subunit ribosomal protein L28
MPSVCEYCAKKPSFNYQVSFSHKRSKRMWKPNVQRVRVWENGRARRANVCTSCIKAGRVTKPPLPQA